MQTKYSKIDYFSRFLHIFRQFVPLSFYGRSTDLCFDCRFIVGRPSGFDAPAYDRISCYLCLWCFYVIFALHFCTFFLPVTHPNQTGETQSRQNRIGVIAW